MDNNLIMEVYYIDYKTTRTCMCHVPTGHMCVQRVPKMFLATSTPN